MVGCVDGGSFDLDIILGDGLGSGGDPERSRALAAKNLKQLEPWEPSGSEESAQ